MAVKCILTGQTPSVLDGVTENVQTQIDAKAADNAVVHLAENETISGAKTFTGKVVMNGSDNVGIGTTTPSEKLEVTGNIKATKFKGDGSELTNISYPVTKVAGKTGAVTLTKGDVGLGNVDNTSDANKPISNATQAALNNKQSKITANGILKGDGTGNITAADETEVELVDITPESIGAQPKIIANGFLTSDGEGNVGAEQPVLTVRVWERGAPTPGEKPGEYIYDFGSDYNYAQIIDAQRRGYMVVVNYNGLEYHFTQNDSSYGLIFSTMILSHNCMYGRLRCTSDDKWHIESYTLVSMEHPFRDTTTLTLTEVIQNLENEVGSAQGEVNSLKNKIASITERKMSIVLYSGRWTGSDPYTQRIGTEKVNTKADIQPSEELYDQLVADGVGYLAIKNVDGTLTAVAKGNMPTVDLTVQMTLKDISSVEEA